MRCVLLILTFLLSLVSEAETILTSSRELTAALRDRETSDERFAITALVSYVSTNIADRKTNVALIDESGATLCRAEDRNMLKDVPQAGARAICRGFVERNAYDLKFAVLTDYEQLALLPAPQPVPFTRAQIFDGSHDYTLCKVEGSLRDVTINETNPYWILLAIVVDEGRVFATVPISSPDDFSRLDAAVGSQISVSGICVPYDHSPRIQTGRIFKIPSVDNIRLLDSLDEAGEDIPFIESIRPSQALDIAFYGRHRAHGRVIAVSKSGETLLQTDNNDLIGLDLSKCRSLPSYGAHIEAVGLPETDLFRINLVNATWTLLDDSAFSPPPVRHVSADEIIRNRNGSPHVDYEHHGQAIMLVGHIRKLPNDADAHLYIESDRRLVPVDVGLTFDAPEDFPVGSRVSVSGTCVMNVEPLRISSTIPRLTGFTLFMRTASDLQLLAYPPSWTTRRWLTLCGILLAVILGFLVWNAILRKMVERRGHELAVETIAHATSAFKVHERTRLAVELHDSLAQNLTAISLEIDTANRLAQTGGEKMREHLAVASSALKSCRNELRNCLWDLRHETLESEDMERAIADTLSPHIGTAKLLTRFKVPREMLCDHTAHAILRIIRELTINAVRHGRATEIKVAGCVEDHRLLFSVTDNGCGFDPENRPDETTGHYGLLGIRERINSFEGELTIESTPGRGCRISVTLHLPTNPNEESIP